MENKNSKIPTMIKQNNANRPQKRCREGSAQSESGDSIDLNVLAESQNKMREQLNSVITKSDLSNIIGQITENVFSKLKEGFEAEFKMMAKQFDDKLDTVMKMNHNLKKENSELRDEIQALNFEMKNCTSQANKAIEIQALNFEMKNCTSQANKAIEIGNYNEQFSRKSNLKFFNISYDGKDPLPEKMCSIIKDISKGDVLLDTSDIVAVHPIPSHVPNKPKPIIMKVKNSEVKSRIMKFRKSFFEANIPVFNDVTKVNLELIKRLKSEGYVSSAWFYNCYVYAKSEDRKPVRIDLFDDYEDKIKSAPKEN